MALCKFCSMDIPDTARICPYCRKRAKGMAPGWIVMLVLLGCVMAFFVIADFVANVEKKEMAELKPEIMKFMYTCMDENKGDVHYCVGWSATKFNKTNKEIYKILAQ